MKVKGRGAYLNPPNRFIPVYYEKNTDSTWDEEPSPATEFYRDESKTAITYNESLDLGFNAGLNPYRGCEHGCVYCYARPSHEYFGLSSGLDFETKIFIKEKAPELLRKELSSRRWVPQVVHMSGVTDPYQPVERYMKITRRCLEVFLEFKNPVAIVTKNYSILRDLDILKKLAEMSLVSVCISITTMDEELRRKLEPRTVTSERRFEAVRILSENGIPAGILVSPIIPSLNDEEIPEILRMAKEAGAQFAWYSLIRLPYKVKDIFIAWLRENYPLREKKILNKIRSIHNGKLCSGEFFTRFSGRGEYAELFEGLFNASMKKLGFVNHYPDLRTDLFAVPGAQMRLFNG